MKYIVSWKIKMPDKVGGTVLKGETRSYAPNLEEALKQIKDNIESFWKDAIVQVVEYGRNFPDENVEIPRIRTIKVV